MSAINSTNTQQFFNLLKDTKSVLIFSHVNPDGDAVGSSLALTSAFKSININTQVVLPNRAPENLRWLPNFECIAEGLPKTKVKALIEASDLIICVDFNQSSRVEKYKKLLDECTKPIVLIDHHQDPKLNSTISFSDTKVSSTCELVHLILRQNPDITLDENYATCIYVGIITDTGVFSYSSSHTELFSTVIELINLGIKKDYITQQIFNTLSENRLRFLGYTLNERMVVMPEVNSAYIYLTLEDQKKFNYQPGDAENFVNYPLTIKNIRFTALFQERENDVKISFRSEGKFKVNLFANKYFNGGGHVNAAGGKSHTSITETIERFVMRTKEHAHEI